ncbi:hypothetical protein HaLaN_19268 [Haematococcus lacustris]|uniref:Cyclic nucleotide-binding domain-containing protein n=1 Tax=Haematococcus lacustris TaxID=44745 RepID=A0A699ZUB8_HAELA|nr:hypothetical protein HaLaN_19268 [Haematococcus lacustris]
MTLNVAAGPPVELPLQLRIMTISHMTRDSLLALPLVQAWVQAYSGRMGSQAEIVVVNALAAHMECLEVAPGHELCLEGDPASAMWFLADGEMAAISERYCAHLSTRGRTLKAVAAVLQACCAEADGEAESCD